MDIFHFRQFDEPGPHKAVITIGNFDGVHVGHQALISQVVQEAESFGVKSALLTFHPHPQFIVRGEAPPLLTTPAQRLKLFEGMGLDSAYFIPFTRSFASIQPGAFVEDYLLSYFQIRKLIIGFDFHFGRNRSGSADNLRALSVKHGFDFEVFPEVLLDHVKVSSSFIRTALASCDFVKAGRFLGRPFGILEHVSTGNRRGHQLGFPTINQITEDRLPIPFGVYVSKAMIKGEEFRGVSNYGVKPTVGSPVPTLETHLFDFERDCYGEMAEVFPLHRIRDEKKFDSLDALKMQIAKDREQALEYHTRAG